MTIYDFVDAQVQLCLNVISILLQVSFQFKYFLSFRDSKKNSNLRCKT